MARGDVLLINLPATDGREQGGRRPAIAVQTNVAGEPMLMVAPITSNSNALRFKFAVKIEPSNENGLAQTSIVMIFQMRAIDKNRIVKLIGKISGEDLKKIDAEIGKCSNRLTKTYLSNYEHQFTRQKSVRLRKHTRHRQSYRARTCRSRLINRFAGAK